MRHCNGPVSSCLLLSSILLSSCTNTVIDEHRPGNIVLDKTYSAVVLGRRHLGDHETESSFVSCLTDKLSGGGEAGSIIAEQEFLDRLYPWFEPRTAPLQPRHFQALLENPRINEVIDNMQLRYVIWVDGSTEKVNSNGAISCAVGPGGAGCIGFGSWEDSSDYKVSVWDLTSFSTVAEISAAATGTSYMPALIVPIPLMARVKSDVCGSVSTQIKQLFSAPEVSQTRQ